MYPIHSFILVIACFDLLPQFLINSPDVLCHLFYILADFSQPLDRHKIQYIGRIGSINNLKQTLLSTYVV